MVTNFISDKAKIGDNVKIWHFSYIGDNVEIGDNVK
ncbi:MAG: N-acetyltransferase, partial [Nitrosarchaeum sp.]